MTLPSSGQLSFQDIATELGTSPPHSLRGMSDIAGKGTPDAVSEFYGYTYKVFTISDYTSQNYGYTGSQSNYPTYDIYSSDNWYATVDTSEIGSLSFSPLSASAGWSYGAAFSSTVGFNNDNWVHVGGVDFYYDSDDTYADHLSACQNGQIDTCN